MADRERPSKPISIKNAGKNAGKTGAVETGAAGGESWIESSRSEPPPPPPSPFSELDEAFASPAGEAFPEESTGVGEAPSIAAAPESGEAEALPESFITDFEVHEEAIADEELVDAAGESAAPSQSATQSPTESDVESDFESTAGSNSESNGGAARTEASASATVDEAARRRAGSSHQLPSPRVAAPPPPPIFEEAPRPTDEQPALLRDNGLFRQEAQRLARARDWQKLAAITRAAVDGAAWAHLPETRAALLVDLARIYRDRLADPRGAEEIFHRLAQLEPAHADAIAFLAARFQERGDWRALYDLYAAAIEPTWDPNQRLEWTRETVAIATDKLRSPDLAIESWERLWRLGDAVEETTRALSDVYRKAGRWDRLAEFLGKRAALLTGAEKIVALREIAEAFLSGMRAEDRAAEVLSQILAERPDDPLALLALARVLTRRKDWEALAELGARPPGTMAKAALLDLRRLVADALWSSGDLDRALVAHERVLELDPSDPEALKAKEEYLERSGRSEALVGFLSERAEGAATDEERGTLLGRAAELAEHALDDPRLAVALWERRAAIEREGSGRLAAQKALARLYESLGELAAVATALEGQLALTRHPATRVELLRRLGDHYAHRLGKDEKAEACWKEVAQLVPDDRATRDELIALHRRRGDFEALDYTLSSQGWGAVDEDAVLSYWRAAAANLEDNIADPARAIRAWLRVLDLAPGDAAALRALVGHHRTLGRSRELIAILEAELCVTSDGTERVERALEIARLWEAEGDRAAALGAYERILRWSPTDGAALAAVAHLRSGVEASAFEAAAAAPGVSGAERIALHRQALALGDPEDKLGRLLALRRIFWLSEAEPSLLDEVARAATEAGAFSDLGALYLDAASATTDEESRAAYLRELAAVCESRLSDPVRAFLALLSIGHQPIADGATRAALARLAESTGRHEDVLALLDVEARAGNPIDSRRDALRRRAVICEQKLGDPERAFHECRRLLGLDPTDAEALGEARRLAGQKQMWRPLDALYAELADRATSTAARIELVRARHAVCAEKLGDAKGALDHLLVIYRLDPEAPGIAAELHAAADAERAWDRVLPLIEARARAVGAAASPEELVRVAALHEDKRGDRQRAFELYAEAFALQPDRAELVEKLATLAQATGHPDLLANCYRFAAARSTDLAQVLDLQARVTALYEQLGRHDDALDVHRRILQLQPAPASLAKVIEHDRAAGNFRALRDRLRQWVDHAPADRDGRTDRLLEIARLSRDPLADAEAALATFAQILDEEPGNEEALAGVRSLTEGAIDPALELRRLRIELKRATPERRVELQLACAEIQKGALDDSDGAIATLRELSDQAGAAGPGFEPLLRLYRERKQWSELVDLIAAHAEALGEGEARIAALQQAVAVCDEHAAAAPVERKERLYRRLLEEQPGDGETRRRLLSLYRDAGRFEEIAALLKATLDTLPYGSFEEQAELEGELCRVYDRALGHLDAAEALVTARAERSPDDAELQLGLASLKLRRGDFAGWLSARERHARRLSPGLGALVLCHLAEACEERPEHQGLVANFYRDARALDPTNPPAMEALKAIGRRARNWRATAAMLPDADESTLSWSERATRLRERGEAAADPVTAIGWLSRSVAVDPDHFLAWDALARLRAQSGDHLGALAAQRASLAAFERATSPTSATLADHAERIQRVADALRAVGDEAEAARQSQRAYQALPSFAAAALTVADERLAEGHTDAAYAIYDRVLRDHASGAAPLTAPERLHATFRRGAIAAQLGRSDQAIGDLREGLRIDPLHPGVLHALADALAERGRVAAAIQHYIQALLVVLEPDRRGALYARLGRMWEDRLATPDEAGVCYDLAIAAGLDDGDLMARALKHYRRSGNRDRALSVIERLLPSTTDPRELAALWTERGGILAGPPQSDEDKAIEAFDMALSYDPGNGAALAGLSELLERRGDWEQLMQIFEARTESGGPEERAEAMRALGRIADGHLHDPVRFEKYLRAAIEIAPVKEDFEKLLALLGDDPARASERRAVIAGLLGTTGPWMARVIELGRMLFAEDERRWAWCLLAPLIQTNMPDPTLKTMVLELRREFEKTDNSAALTPSTHVRVRHPDVDEALLGVLGELGRLGPIGRTTAEQAGASGVGKLDERTAVGKTFAAIAARLGQEGAQLQRAQELPEPFVVLDVSPPQVVVRAELLQLLSVAETSFLFAMLLELARPGPRAIASLAPAERALLVPALLHATGLAEATPEIEPLAARIRALADPARLGALGAALFEVRIQDAALGERTARGIVETARRVGLVAAADLRFVSRLLTRLDDTLPKLQQAVIKIPELDDLLAASPPVRSLLAFAATEVFGKALAG